MKRAKGKKRARRKTQRVTAPQRLTISLNLIAKDEAASIGRCLESVEGVVDEMIVVDTGSADDTAQIAASHGAQVLSFPWTDDFSAARNHGLTHCCGDWILSLDADERLDPGTKHCVREAAATPNVDLWYLRLLNLYPDGESGTEVRLVRLFRRTPGMHYVGRIHEQLMQNLAAAVAGHSQALIHHDGYHPTVMEEKQKIARNVRLLELGLKDTENGGSAMLRSSYLHYWAMNSQGAERLRRLEEFSQYVDTHFDDLKERMAWIPSGLLHYAAALRNAGRRSESADVARRMLAGFGEAPILHAFIAGGHLAAGRLERAEEELKIALSPEAKLDHRHQEYVLPPETRWRLAKLTLAELRERQQQWAEAETLYEELVEGMEAVRPRLAHIQVRQQKHQRALETLEKSPQSLDQTRPEEACLAFILSLIVQSTSGLLRWGEKVRLSADSEPLCRRVLRRVEAWEVGRAFTPDDFPELSEILQLPAAQPPMRQAS